MAELVVTTLTDERNVDATIEAPGGDGLSLREALGIAVNGDTISFEDGLSGTIRISGLLRTPTITADVTIYGDDRITISGDSNGDDTLVNGVTDLATTAATELDDNQKIFFIDEDLSNVVLDGLTLTGGRGDNYGGAVDAFSTNLTITGSTFAGNIVYGGVGGGAIYTKADLTISDSTFFGNTAIDGSRDSGTGGGAIASLGGALSVVNSTFVGNKAVQGEGMTSPSGGAIFSNGDVTGSTYLNNVTITGNLAENQGGGLFLANPAGGVTIMNSIILGNKADEAAGSAANEVDGSDISMVSVSNSITDGDDATDIFAETETVNGVVAGVLGDNGGQVQTVALLGSVLNPALDVAATAGTDARGNARADLAGVDNGGAADLGAFEFQAEDDSVAPVFSRTSIISVGETLLSGLSLTPVTVIDLTAVTFSIESGADAGAVSIDETTGVLSFTGTVDFENPSDANGDNRFEFTVKATDEGGNFATDDITIDITDINEAPEAAASTASGDENTVISGALMASDQDGDTLSFSVVSGPSNGAVTIGDSGAFSFTPAADFSGTDSFTFSVGDGALSDTATATITVNPVDEPIDQIDPVDPVDPIDPVDPVDPIDPVDPVDPPTPTGPTAGDDTLVGTTLNDTIDALAGNDDVTGLAGDDLLFGRSGDDNIRGSAGDDSLRGNGGDDTLKGNGGADNIKGNGGEDVIRGNGGDDVIRAGGGADNVKGGGGADLIFGGGGSDQLNGGGGADTLRGNGGDDTLKGNGGADVFQFRSNDRNDTIADFRQGQDKIEILNGANSFEALRIEQDGADVLIGFGGAGQIRVITDNAGALDESDFIF